MPRVCSGLSRCLREASFECLFRFCECCSVWDDSCRIWVCGFPVVAFQYYWPSCYSLLPWRRTSWEQCRYSWTYCWWHYWVVEQWIGSYDLFGFIRERCSTGKEGEGGEDSNGTRKWSWWWRGWRGGFWESWRARTVNWMVFVFLISLYCGIFFCILRLNYSQVDRRV